MNTKMNDSDNQNKQLQNYRNLSGIPNDIYDSLYLFTCINYT